MTKIKALLRTTSPGSARAREAEKGAPEVTRLFDADSWMWEEALSTLEIAERRHRRFFALLGMHTHRPTWEPPADVFETDSDVWIVIALPGVPPDRIVLRVDAAELVVQTERAPRPRATRSDQAAHRGAR